MKKWLHRLSYLLGALSLLMIAVFVNAGFIGSAKLNKVHVVPAQAIAIPSEQASIADGKRLVSVRIVHGLFS